MPEIGPIFLTVEQIVAIHADQTARYGGSARLRDEKALLSAAWMPEARFSGEYAHPGLAAKAAAYPFHLVSNHAVVDGNKRVGLAAALTYLYLNGHELDCPLDRVEDMTIRVASGMMPKDDVVAFFEQTIRPVSD